MSARENGMAKIKNEEQGVNGAGYSMHTTQQSTRTTGQATERTSDRAGQGITKLLRAGLLGLTLAVCMMGAPHEAAASTQKKTAPAQQRQESQERDSQGDDAKSREDGHADELPTITLTSPANNSANLYPAPFALEAVVTFSGKAEGRNDKREGVEVEFLADGTKFADAERAPYRANYTPSKAGIHILTARIRYGEGKRIILSNAVTAVSGLPPAVSLATPAANTVVTAPATFALSATASAPIGSIARLEYYSGTTLIGTATQAPYSFTWNNVPAGSYAIVARATDSYGFSSTSAPVSVISNAPPAVNLISPTANAVSVAPGSFTLSANATDGDGTIAKVEFYATDTATNTRTLIGTATAAPYGFSWSNVAAGHYTLTAVATDNLGASTTSASVSVIADALPTISLTSPAANAASVAPGTFTLGANAASTTSTIAKVEFYATDSATNTSTLIGTATAGSNGAYSFTWANVPAGSYRITAVATDALGTTATSAMVNVTSDKAPTVTLTSPANGAQITSPNSFTLTADATSVTSTIAKVEFFNGATLLGAATTAPYTYTWSNVPVGSYSLTAKATDALGIATTSAATGVTAIANVPPTVSLTSPANGATVKVPGSFTLTATAASTTSAIAKVDFYASNGTTNTLVGTATTAPYSFAWSNVALGSYSITAVATDTLNAATSSSAINVTVNTGVAQAYYIHTDHLDTPRQITDTSGNVVWQWDNTDPFGNNPPNENPSGLGVFEFNKRHPGQYFDKETNTFYNYYRDCYDPATGRYCQSDPIGLWGGSFSTFIYVNDNPLSKIDPKGLAVVLPGPVPLPVPGPTLPAPGKPKGDDSLDPFPPGNGNGAGINTERPVPEPLPPRPPRPPGTGCRAMFEACVRGSNAICPALLKPVGWSMCFSLWLACEARGDGG